MMTNQKKSSTSHLGKKSNCVYLRLPRLLQLATLDRDEDDPGDPGMKWILWMHILCSKTFKTLNQQISNTVFIAFNYNNTIL